MTDTKAGTAGHEQGKVEKLKSGTTHAYDATLDTARDAMRRTTDSLETNPLAVIAGGLAVGALAGALLPKTDNEKKLFGPIGKRLSDAATAAAAAARDAGRDQISAALPDRDTAKEQLRQAFGNVVQAAKDGGKAAGEA